jgi:predicted GNAT family acetyltransferase
MQPIDVTNQLEKQQFEIHSEGKLAFLQYQLYGHQLILVHTVVPPELEGKGIGSALAKTGLEYARQNQLKVVPICPFVRSYLQRHHEYQDLVQQSSDPSSEK